jgi:DNA-directed RNA polymerase subunit H (RpoH/RPB5)
MSYDIDAATADILMRSRHTTLDILEDRGYDTSQYRNIAPDQILTLAGGHPRALDIFVPKREGSNAPCDRAVVIYQIKNRIRNKLAGSFKDELFESYDGSDTLTISEKDDIIVIVNEPYNDTFDRASLSIWQQDKVRLTYFHLKQVVVHMGRHVLVPPHRKLTADEAKAEVARLHVSQKTQLPLIKHSDMQARLLGMVPGDIVEIMRPSPTAGIARVLRVCSA